MQNDTVDVEAELRRLAGAVARLEERLAATERELAAERAAREALEERLAGLDRAGRRGGSGELVRPERAAPARDDEPGRLQSVLADWGFGAKSRQKPSAEASPKPARSPEPGPGPAARPSAPSMPPTPRVAEVAAPAAAPEPEPKPKEPPPRVAAARAPFDTSAPTVLDALERDATITPGQRETLRMIYVRFFPDAAPNPASTLPEGATVGDVLETDPNLQHGQREALRTMYHSFGAHRRKAT